MADLTPNIPELWPKFAKIPAYEQALIDKDVDVLDATFWRSPHAIRLAMNEHGYNKAIHAHRVARTPGRRLGEKRLRPEILTLGRDLATVNLVLRCALKAGGRQSQTFVRFPEDGWKVVSAHVSTTDGSALW